MDVYSNDQRGNTLKSRRETSACGKIKTTQLYLYLIIMKFILNLSITYDEKNNDKNDKKKIRSKYVSRSKDTLRGLGSEL